MAKIKSPRIFWVALICATVCVAPVREVRAVSLAEYPLLLFLIVVATFDVQDSKLPPASQLLTSQLEIAAEGARAANVAGDRIAELGRLSKAVGAAEGLMGMAAACSDCQDLRQTLQQIIGQASLLKTAAVGASGSCHPNGLLQPNEQCDPSAVPTGCPVDTIAPLYCSDECRCAAPPIP